MNYYHSLTLFDATFHPPLPYFALDTTIGTATMPQPTLLLFVSTLFAFVILSPSYQGNLQKLLSDQPISAPHAEPQGNNPTRQFSCCDHPYFILIDIFVIALLWPVTTRQNLLPLL